MQKTINVDSPTMQKICIITGTRAEYGLLKPLIDLFNKDDEVLLQLIVTGSHLSNEYGYTIQEIENDGFAISDKIEILLSSNSSIGVTKSFGLACIGLADSLTKLNPDLLILLGDRYEVLAAAVSAAIARIPIAHLHGGEVTEGALDELFRHAITKLSTIHFASTAINSSRIIQMGENPAHVFNVGAIGLDALETLQIDSKAELEQKFGIKICNPVLLVTLHPETCLSPEYAKMHALTLVEALDYFPQATMIVTGANADAGGRYINSILEDFVEKRRLMAPTYFASSLGQNRYLSTLKQADLVIGNSSSGIIEAHASGTVCINIGDRQKGREQAQSVINCGWDVEEIKNGISAGLSHPHIEHLASKGIYGEPGVAKRIAAIIKTIEKSLLRVKPFCTISGSKL